MRSASPDSLQVSRKAAQQSQVLQALYQEEVQRYAPDQLCFADESAVNETSTVRRWGYGRQGRKVIVQSSFTRSKRHSLLPLVSIDGFLAIEAIQDAYNAERFEKWVVDVALPQMNAYPLPYSVLVIDNCGIHREERVRALCTERGVNLVMLPPYSPHLNPIETAFGVFKKYLQAHFEDTSRRDLPEVLMEAAKRCLKGDMMRNVYRNCGYVYASEAQETEAQGRYALLPTLEAN